MNVVVPINMTTLTHRHGYPASGEEPRDHRESGGGPLVVMKAPNRTACFVGLGVGCVRLSAAEWGGRCAHHRVP